MARVLIAGCGYVGTELAKSLAADGHRVWGLRRSPQEIGPGIETLAADLTRAETLENLPAPLDFVFYTAGSDASTEAAYRAIYVDGLRNVIASMSGRTPRPKRLLLTSSTAVYAQRDGQWVDESSVTEPTTFQGRLLLESEALALAAPFPATVVRFGGIYGPGRRRLIEQVRQGAARVSDKPAYTNRIHRDDCAGFLRHVMMLEQPRPLYLAVDDDPADRRTVLEWLASRIGAPPPRPDANGTGSNKRCRNDLMTASGYRLRYPTFRHGYAEVLRELEV